LGAASTGGRERRPPVVRPTFASPAPRVPLFFSISSNRSPALISARMRISVACSISSSLLWAINPCHSHTMNGGERRAMNILRELHAAEEELVGRAVVLTDGKAGTIDHVFLDDVHGLRISIGGHEGRWPISTVKHIE
jgi:hypothetical protein